MDGSWGSWQWDGAVVCGFCYMHMYFHWGWPLCYDMYSYVGQYLVRCYLLICLCDGLKPCFANVCVSIVLFNKLCREKLWGIWLTHIHMVLVIAAVRWTKIPEIKEKQCQVTLNLVIAAVCVLKGRGLEEHIIIPLERSIWRPSFWVYMMP